MATTCASGFLKSGAAKFEKQYPQKWLAFLSAFTCSSSQLQLKQWENYDFHLEAWEFKFYTAFRYTFLKTKLHLQATMPVPNCQACTNYIHHLPFIVIRHVFPNFWGHIVRCSHIRTSKRHGTKTRERYEWLQSVSEWWCFDTVTTTEGTYVPGEKTGRSKVTQFYFSLLGEEDILHWERRAQITSALIQI